MKELRAFVREALAEDVGHGDITTEATIGEHSRCKAWLVAKQDGVLSGMRVFRMVFDLLDADVHDWESMPDGAPFQEGGRVAGFQGRTGAILTGERLALNFVQRLSGVATLTSRYVKAVEGLPVRICDTRKTTPQLRKLEKEAVRHGGGVNHRYALFDGVLIKDNHIVGAGSIATAIQRAREHTHHLLKIGVEVTDRSQLEEAIASQADAVLLDNMSLDDMREAAARIEGTRIVSEASGNVTLERVRAIAETGVQFISVGALTHSAPAVDFSLVIQNA